MRDHELFAPEGDEKQAPDVVKIMVYRQEPQGMVAWSAGFVPAEQLPDVPALFERCGGGRYELVARDAKRITARRTITLAGPPKPLDGGAAQAAAQVAAQSQPMQVPTGGAIPAWLPALLGIAAPIAAAYIKSQADERQAQSQLMLAVMQNRTSDANAHVQAMQQMYSSQTTQMVALFTALKEGNDPTELLFKGIELATGLREGANEGGGGGGGADAESMVDAVSKGLDLVTKVKSMVDSEPTMPKTNGKRRAPPPPPPEPEPEPEPEPTETEDEEEPDTGGEG